MRLPGRNEHLTYCTNVRRGETWDEVWRLLQGDVLAVRRDVAPDRPFAVGLRLSGIALMEAAQPTAVERVQSYLRDNDVYIFILNAFPYAPFHGLRVKENVFLPDWLDEERLRYTQRLGRLPGRHSAGWDKRKRQYRARSVPPQYDDA